MGKKQINVVSLSDIKTVDEEDNNVVNNNDELSQIKEAIKEEEALNPPQEPETEQLESKPKPKRKSPTKKTKVVEDEPVAIPPVVEVKESPVEEPQKKVKTLELVSCPKCEKQMTKRTLRYDHPKTCPGQAIEREKIPVKKRTKTEPEAKPQTKATLTIPEDVIEHEIKKRLNNSIQERLNQKLKVKEDRIKKLSAQIA